jgi:ADP-heptose:LPS heptosyltransferase
MRIVTRTYTALLEKIVREHPDQWFWMQTSDKDENRPYPMKALIINKLKPKFLVFRNGDIGNTLIATPFLRNLKESYPDSHISVVVDNIGLIVLKNNPYVDDFYVFERHSDTWRHQLQLIRKWRSERYDVSFHLRTGVRNEFLAFLSNIPNRIGFRLHGSFQFLTQKIRAHEIEGHIIIKTLSLLERSTGIKPHIYHPELFQDAQASGKIDLFLRENGLLKKEYVVIHPTGKNIGSLNWNFDYFKKLMALVSRRKDAAFVLVGAISETPFIQESFSNLDNVISAMHLDLSEKSELIRRAAFFIGNDSGPAHIAEAWDVPKIVIYHNDPRKFSKWHPVKEGKFLVVFQDEMNSEKTLCRIEDFIAATLENPGQSRSAQG